MDELLAVIVAIEDYPKWCYQTSSVNLIKVEGNKIYYSYRSKTPPIVSDREAYFCIELSTDSLSGSEIVDMNVYQSSEPVPKGIVRIPYAKGSWTFTPLDSGEILVVFQMHADPGGKIPAWLANLASVESPRVTLDNFRKMVKKRRIN